MRQITALKRPKSVNVDIIENPIDSYLLGRKWSENFDWVNRPQVGSKFLQFKDVKEINFTKTTLLSLDISSWAKIQKILW